MQGRRNRVGVPFQGEQDSRMHDRIDKMKALEEGGWFSPGPKAAACSASFNPILNERWNGRGVKLGIQGFSLFSLAQVQSFFPELKRKDGKSFSECLPLNPKLCITASYPSFPIQSLPLLSLPQLSLCPSIIPPPLPPSLRAYRPPSLPPSLFASILLPFLAAPG
jgi:hypothetical protein